MEQSIRFRELHGQGSKYRTFLKLFVEKLLCKAQLHPSLDDTLGLNNGFSRYSHRLS